VPQVQISRPDKLLFPDAGVTKRDLASYYEHVATAMLPHVRARPVSMQRYPNGIDGPGFFQKDIPDYFPDWIKRIEVRKKDGTVTHAITCDANTLIYLAAQACITPHIWLSRAGELERPDRMVFDFDPSGGAFASVRRAALWLRALLDELELASFVMTTGSRGLHVWVPLRPGASFDEVRGFARDTAGLLARRHPRELTIEQRKAKRRGRILIDVMRNAYAQTAVPPYAVRPRPKAPVATPLDWDEISDSKLRPDRYTTRNLFRRLRSQPDPWAGISRRARQLNGARRRLDELLAEC
jgi:bifunctional non-homologous end joining protein LigD